MKLPLHRIAHARSGDKGNGSNVGLIAYDRASFELIKRQVTPARVKSHFRSIVKGKVERFEVPNLLAFNFLLHDSLGGGGSASLKNDAQGKTHGMALLLMEIDAPPGFVPPPAGKGRPEARPRPRSAGFIAPPPRTAPVASKTSRVEPARLRAALRSKPALKAKAAGRSAAPRPKAGSRRPAGGARRPAPGARRAPRSKR